MSLSVDAVIQKPIKSPFPFAARYGLLDRSFVPKKALPEQVHIWRSHDNDQWWAGSEQRSPSVCYHKGGGEVMVDVDCRKIAVEVADILYIMGFETTIAQGRSRTGDNHYFSIFYPREHSQVIQPYLDGLVGQKKKERPLLLPVDSEELFVLDVRGNGSWEYFDGSPTLEEYPLVEVLHRGDPRIKTSLKTAWFGSNFGHDDGSTGMVLASSNNLPFQESGLCGDDLRQLLENRFDFRDLPVRQDGSNQRLLLRFTRESPHVRMVVKEFGGKDSPEEIDVETMASSPAVDQLKEYLEKCRQRVKVHTLARMPLNIDSPEALKQELLGTIGMTVAQA